MTINRRRFLTSLLGGVAATVASGRLNAEELEELTKSVDTLKLPRKKLGNTKIEASILGMGTGSIGWGGNSNQTRLGRKPFVSLLEYAHDRGVTYFDMADQYGSHTYMRDALKENGGTIPREKVMLLTKSTARSAEDMQSDLDRFRKEVGTDYFDVVLLHCKTGGEWNKSHAGAMEVLSKAKEKGIIRAHGVSCHSLSALKTAAKEPWVEVDLVRYNPWNMYMDADKETVGTVIKEMKDAGKGTIGMKILAQGERVEKEHIREGIRHAVNTPLLDLFTIGFESREQLNEVMTLIPA